MLKMNHCLKSEHSESYLEHTVDGISTTFLPTLIRKQYILTLMLRLVISRNWRSKGLRGIRSLRNSMSIENVWTHSENCS